MINEIKNEDGYSFLVNIFSNYVLDKDPFRKVFGFYLDDTLIGVIDVSVIYERMEINYIAILNEYRRHGVGRKLIDSVLKKFKINSVSLEVSSNNTNALLFYEKIGFKKTAIRKGYYKGIDGILMVMEVR